MLQPLVRALIAADPRAGQARPHDVGGYIVLGALNQAPEGSPSALAEKIAADKTRLIGTLDAPSGGGR